jgi:hypothetical protein
MMAEINNAPSSQRSAHSCIQYKQSNGTILVSSRTKKIQIKDCPPAGEGVHRWVYHAWCTLCKGGFTDEEAREVCEVHATRPLTRADFPKELPIEKSGIILQVQKAVYREERLIALASKLDGFEEEDLLRKSPIYPVSISPADFLRALYEPGDRVLVFDEFRTQGQGFWTCPAKNAAHEARALERFIRPPRGEGAWFLINPTDAELRENPRLGKKSRRAEENLTAFRYGMFESDKASLNLWIRAVAQLPLPIVSLTTSGGDSLHAIVRVGALTADEFKTTMQELRFALVTLGADEATVTKPVQLSRLPGCYRAEKKGWQRLLYLNPQADGTPICDLPDRNFISE